MNSLLCFVYRKVVALSRGECRADDKVAHSIGTPVVSAAFWVNFSVAIRPDVDYPQAEVSNHEVTVFRRPQLELFGL